MGYNKIPLALKFNDDTGNAEGLIEFQLNVSDIGDICEDGYNPSPGDVLTYDSGLDCWTASATPAVAAGALSALTDVCTEVTSVTSNQALVWNGSYWCPSTIPTGGGGGGITSISDAGDVNFDAPGNGELIVYDTNEWVNKTVAEAGLATTAAIANVAYTNQPNTFTQSNTFQDTVKLANVAQNSLMITDATSAVSSVSGASGSLIYFSGTTPRPVLTGIRTVLDEASVTLSDLTDVCDATPSEGQALVWSSTGVWCASTIPTGGGGGDPLPTATNPGDIILADGPGTAYSASAPSDAGIMQLDPYFAAGDDGAVAQWDGTKLEVKFPDALFIRVTQDNTVHSGETITKGDVVYATSSNESGNRIYVGLANAGDPNRMPAIGIAETTINPGNSGKIITFGRADGVNTTLDGSAIAGDTLYVGTTNGKLAVNKPDQPTELIQNVGIVTQAGVSGRIKVTGVGRSNDIPVNVDVVGSATIGTNEFTQTSAKLANVGADHILISTAASATSSVLSSTLFGNYYTKSEADGQFLEETTNLTGIADVSGTPAANYILQRNLGDNNWDPVTMNAALLATGERVEDHSIEDLANVSQGETPGWPNGCILQYDETAGGGDGAFVSATLPGADSSDHGVLTGLGDDDHTQYVLSAGTREMATLTVTGAANFSGNLNVQPSGYNQLSGCPLPVIFQKQNGYPIASSNNSTIWNTGTSAYGVEVFSSVIPANTLLNYDVEIVLRGRVGLAGQSSYRMATTLNGRMSIFMSGGQVNNANDGRYEKVYRISRLESNRQMMYVTYKQGLPGASWITQGYGGGFGTINGITYDGIVHNETLAPDTSDITLSVLFSQNTTSGYMTVDSAVVTFIPNV